MTLGVCTKGATLETMMRYICRLIQCASEVHVLNDVLTRATLGGRQTRTART